MKVTKIDIDAFNAILKLEVKKEDFVPEIEKTLKDYRKQVDMKGFRKGQVPMGLVKKMYGNAILMETINNKLSDEVNNYIKEHKLDILGHPIPKEGQVFDMEMKDLKDFTFEYELGLAPVFELDYLAKKPTFERDLPQVDKKILDEEVSRMQKQLGTLETVDTIEEDTDMLSVTFAEMLNGELREDGITNSSSISLELVSDKKVAEKLKKLKKGEVIYIDIFNTFTQDDDAVAKHLLSSEKSLILNNMFRMTLDEIKRTSKAEINEEFLQKVYGKETGLKNEKDLRDKIKADLNVYFDKQADNKMFNDVYAKMIEETKLELPDKFLQRWIRLTNEKPISKEQVAAEYEGFKKNLVWSLIVKKIKNDGKIEITEEEIREKTAEGIKQQMMQFGMNDFAGPEMESFVNNMMEREEHVNQTKDAILEEKVFQYLKSQITVKDKKVTLEEFNASAKA